MADEDRLAQMVSNLLTSALKFTSRGGRVRVSVEGIGSRCRIRVADDGAGIDPADLDRIFEPFVQAHEARGPQGGLGLGLALVKYLVTRHGGSVSAQSDGPGRGAEFTIELPLTTAPSSQGRRRTIAAETSDLSVVICEDNEDAAITLAELLTLAGNRVEVVGTGCEALQLVRDRCPDVLICDLGLPDTDGLQVMREVRAMHEGHRPFAIALTGFARRTTETRRSQRGSTSCSPSPLTWRSSMGSCRGRGHARAVRVGRRSRWPARP